MADLIAPKAINSLKAQIGMNFTQREIQCITMAIRSKTLLQISEYLQLNPKTVYFYLVGVQNKLTLLMQQGMILSDADIE